MSTNLWKQFKATRDYDVPFKLTTAEGELIVGKFTDPETPGQDYGHVLEARGAGDQEYRWVFHKALDKTTIDIILKGFKNDPEFRKQFEKPANIALLDSNVVAKAVQEAFGAHQILATGSADPTAHSWEQETSVVLAEKPPQPFLDFLKKSPLMKMTKAKGGFHLRVTAARGHACEANQRFLDVLSDYAQGALLDPKAYKYELKEICLMPTKPVLRTPAQSKEKLDLEQAIEQINAAKGDAAGHLIGRLKVGRDEFTVMKADALRAKMEPTELATIIRKFRLDTKNETPKAVRQASQCMRWRLRGLTLDQAMLKVDLEVKANQFFADRTTSLKAFE